MQKRWFLICLPLILILFSTQVYSSLSESEKNKFNSCPLLTYINITGEGIIDKGDCRAVTIEQGYNNLNLTTSCDEDYIEPVFSYNSWSKVKQKGRSWILYDFILKENPYYLSKCIKNVTPLENRYIYVNIKTASEIEAEARQKKIKEQLDKIENKTGVVINKSDEVIEISNQSRSITESINKTTTEIKDNQKIQNCKDNFNLLVVILGIILEIVFVVIGQINKRNKKLQQKLWILAFVVIFVMITAMVIITFFMCNL